MSRPSPATPKSRGPSPPTPAQESLCRFYEEWAALTRQEQEAISTLDWPRLAQCHDRKLALSPLIREAGRQIDSAQDSHAGWTAIQSRIRALLQELIRMEQENADALDAQRRRLQSEKHGVDQAERNLRRLHQAYAPSRPGLWHSYS